MKVYTDLLHRLLAVCIALTAFATLSAAADDDYQLLINRIGADFQSNPDVSSTVKLYNASDGSFTDIDYASTAQDGWQPREHLNRLSNFVYAYTNKANRLYGDEVLYNRIVKALEYWMKRRPTSTNWWYAQVAEPQALGVMLVKMRSAKKQLPATLEKSILEHMKADGGDPAKWTGANRTDICLHWIYRSALENNADDMQKAMELAFEPIRFTTSEGFQSDGSYFQHGSQLYIGGYGEEILKGITQIAAYAVGTKFALDSTRTDFVGRFMRETFYPSIRGKYMLYNALGRGVSRYRSLDAAHNALYARRMISIDPAHADDYRKIVSRLEGKSAANADAKPSHTHYYRGDFTVHVRKNWQYSVRMASTRTSRMEYGNDENMKAYFVSDGGNAIVKTGDEYYNIFPVWNWNRIPGTTAPQMEKVPLGKNAWELRGTSTFAGGVSDATYGATTYSYNDTYDGIDTQARKAWFFFDDEVVCLGSGITSGSKYNVLTTLNQCIDPKGSKCEYAMGKERSKLEAGKSIDATNISWVRQNGIGYVFPKGGHVVAERKSQQGNWRDINYVETDRKAQADVATIAIDHGFQPKDATYAYIVVPEATNDDILDDYAQGENISILSNTKNIQAVWRRGLGIWQMVFYGKGQYKDRNIQVKVDNSCVLQIKRGADGKVWLYIADPAQRQRNIKVQAKLTDSMKKAKKLNCNFSNTGEKAGATKAYKLN